ncbi:MAG: hypothetical protein KF684_03705 [Phycisphaeraceae bacterium]|nr:hypothetical protein [Phycisphaeraceae bacterium]
MTRPVSSLSRAVLARTLVACAGLAAIATGPAFAQQVDSNWLNPASGTWSAGANWSTSPNAPNNGAPAGTTYRAIIDAAGAAYTVTLNSGVTIDELVLNSADATLSHTASTLSAAIANLMSGVYRLQGGTISGGTWNVTGGSFQLTSSGGTLSNVQFNGDLLGNATSSFVTLGGTTRFDALRLQANNSQARLAPGYTLRDAIVSEGATAGTRFIYNSGAGTFTIGNTGSVTLASGSAGDLQINSLSGAFTLVNDGLISAQAAGRTLTVNPNTFTNNATAQVSAGALTVSSGSWTNAGLFEVSGGTLNLGGTWDATGGVGSFSRTGGTINLTGTMNNTGNAFNLDASTGSWGLSGGTINGGTITSVGGNTLTLTSSGGALNSVQFNGDLVGNATSSFVTLAGSTRFDALRLQGNNSQVRLNAGYTLRDAIVSEGAAAGARFIYNNAAGTYTIADSGSVTLASGSAGDLQISALSGAFTLVNDGLISAQAAGRTLTVTPSAFTNNATAQVSAGALTVSSGSWTNAGLFDVSGGALNLGGTWDATGGIGSFSRTGGAINLTGTMNNTGNAFNLDASTGSWNLSGGTINGGTITSVGGNTLTLTSSGGALNNVQFNGDLVGNATSSFVTLAGSTRFDALRLQGNNSQVRLNAGYTLRDAIVSEGAAAGARFIYNNATGTYTIADTGSVTLASGSGGDLQISALSGAFTLVNDGLISAQAAGRTLTVNPSAFTNNATAQVSAGALTVSSGSWTNAGLFDVSGGALNLGGTWDATGGIGSFSRTGGAINLTGTMNNTGNAFSLNSSTGSWGLSGGTINGGTITSVGGNTLTLTSSGGTLNSVQFNGDLVGNATSSFVTLAGSTRFDALRLQNNSVQARLSPGYTINDAIIAEGAAGGARFIYNAGAGTYTIGNTGSVTLASGSGADLQITPLSGAFTLVNDGLISAQAAGRTFTVNPNTFTNNGTAQVSAGALTVSSGSWTNAGLFDVSGGTLNLGGTWDATGGIGSFSRTGGAINLTGTMNNTGNAFNLDASTGSWGLAGGTINGGTITSVGGNTLTLTSSGGTLNSVQLNGDLLGNATSSFVTLAGSTRFDALRLQGNNSQVRLAPGYTLRDAIVSEGAVGGARFIYNNGAGTYTIADTGSVTLASGAGGDLQISNLSGAFTLVNDGLISAQAAGRTLTINPSSFVNNGTLEAQNSSALRVTTAGVHTNSADLVVGTNGRIEFVNGFEQASGGVLTVELSGGANTGAGRLAITGNATLGGTLDLSPVGAFEPTWNNAWTIATTTTGTISGDFDSILFPTLADSDHRWWTEINPTSYRVGVRHFADLNYDGVINFADLNIVLSGFGTMGTFRQGDTNADGLVNFSDLNNILSFFGVAAPRAAVPAPGAAVILALGALGVARRRRD